MEKKVVLITGCSSGFGWAAALRFARGGWQVFAGVKEIILWRLMKVKHL